MELESRIQEVTVYADRALVGREVRVPLKAGTHHLHLIGLPDAIVEDSVRVTGDGPEAWLLHGFDLKTVYTGPSGSSRVEALERMLETLLDRQRTLTDAHSVHHGKLTLLQQTTQQAAGGLVHQVKEGRMRLPEWDDLLDFLQTRQTTEAAAVLDVERELREVQAERQRLEAELGLHQGLRHQTRRQVTVTVELPQDATLRLWLEYVIHGASWTPAYDARLSAAGDRLEWRYYGMVRQQTGENWEDVRLKLSTARPAEGSRPPVLGDWYLSVYSPPAYAEGFGGVRRKAAAPGGPFEEESEAYADMAPAAMSAPPAPAPAPAIAVADQGTSVTLEVPRPITVPSSGEPHQAAIGHTEFRPTLKYLVIPKLEPHAYLEVEAVHDGPWPILPGPVKAYVGQDYVGTAPLDHDVMPGQSFRLPMGVDRAVQVKRRRDAVAGEAGMLQKQRTHDYKFTIELASYKPTPVKVRLIEPLPQPTQDDLKVKVGAMSHPAGTEEKGKLIWELPLGPQEQLTLTWGYRVEHPAHLNVVGIESANQAR